MSRLASGDAHRTTYAELAARTRSLALALDQLGVAAIDLENAAVADPDVAEAAVIGIPHPKWQGRPLLLLRCCHQGRRPEMAEVLAFVAVEVPCWWQPDEVRIVGELPHTATGNLLKTRLRELYAGGVL